MIERISKDHFIGKTIKEIDFDRPDQIIFFFDDGTQTTLRTQQEIPSIGMFGFIGKVE